MNIWAKVIKFSSFLFLSCQAVRRRLLCILISPLAVCLKAFGIGLEGWALDLGHQILAVALWPFLTADAYFCCMRFSILPHSKVCVANSTACVIRCWPSRPSKAFDLLAVYRVTTLQTMWNSLTIPWWFATLLRGTWHVKCYSYHARASVTVSGGGRNATVHTCMDTNMQLTINSFRRLFPDKIFSPDFQ